MPGRTLRLSVDVPDHLSAVGRAAETTHTDASLQRLPIPLPAPEAADARCRPPPAPPAVAPAGRGDQGAASVGNACFAVKVVRRSRGATLLYPEPEESRNQVELRDYLRIMRRRWLMIVSCVVVAVAVSAAVTFTGSSWAAISVMKRDWLRPCGVDRMCVVTAGDAQRASEGVDGSRRNTNRPPVVVSRASCSDAGDSDDAEVSPGNGVGGPG